MCVTNQHEQVCKTSGLSLYALVHGTGRLRGQFERGRTVIARHVNFNQLKDVSLVELLVHAETLELGCRIDGVRAI